MPTIRLMPDNTVFTLESGAKLTDIEFDYFGVRLIPFGCRVGVCGACLVQVIDGATALGIPNTFELNFIKSLGVDPQQHRLACQCVLNANVTLRIVSSKQDHLMPSMQRVGNEAPD